MSKDISIEEIIKIFFSENNVPQNKINDFKFLFNWKILNIHDKSTLEQKRIIDGSNILTIKCNEFSFKGKGKSLEVFFKNKTGLNIKTFTGTLNTIRSFYYHIINNFSCSSKPINKITINGKEIQKDDERTFSLIGLRENFSCYIEYEKNE